MEYSFNTKDIKLKAKNLTAGDKVYLSGVVYTARDAAHKRIFELLDKGEKLPFDIDGASIYYAGPTETPKHLVIGSCGPTTSSRMDKFAPRLLDLGLYSMIGKGERSEEVEKAIIKNGAVYFCAIGGAGALACKHIIKNEIIAFDDLGCESIKKLEFKDFPLLVAIAPDGTNLFKR